MPIYEIQRRMMELGRVRLGEKGAKGAPKRLEKFRLTSASRGLLEEAAKLWGGEVKEWKGAPDEGYWELYTETAELPVVFPPTRSFANGEPSLGNMSQWYELWSGGGCVRRCDGRTEATSGGPCLCDPEKRECDIITRLSFMLPDVPGIGVWRLDTSGFNAALELPATIEFLEAQAEEGRYVAATLRLEQRSSRLDGVLRRFAVPVVDLPGVRVRDMLPSAHEPVAIHPPAAPAREKPSLPAGPPPPPQAEPTVAAADIEMGAAPPLPVYDEADAPAIAPDVGVEEPHPSPPPGPAAGAEEAASPPPSAPVGSPVDDVIDEKDRRRIFAAASSAGVSKERVKEIVVMVTGQESTTAIPKSLYAMVLATIADEELEQEVQA